MKRTATVLAIMFGSGAACGLMFQGAIAHENSTASQVKDSGSAGSSTADSTDVAHAKKSGKEKHEKKEHKHHDKQGREIGTDGDGSPLTKLGTHKRVDAGFDFENSKTFHQMGDK